MPIEQRPTLRLALGLAISALIGWGQGGPFAYLLPMLSLLLLAGGAAPPAPGQALALIIVTAISCLWALLLVPVLHHVPAAGVLLILGGVALSAYLAGRRPALAVPLRVFILGDTLIACLAYQSQAAAQLVAVQLILDIALAVIITWSVTLLLPDTATPSPMPSSPPSPLLSPERASWVGFRAATVMACPVVLALINPSLFIMTLMNGALLAQQPSALQVKENGWTIATATAAGGGLAVIFWLVLRLWPSLVLLVGGLALTGLLLGPRLQSKIAGWWQPAFSTMIVVLGSSVADSATGDDIELLMLRRVVMMIALAVMTAVLVAILDNWQERRSPRPALGALGE